MSEEATQVIPVADSPKAAIVQVVESKRAELLQLVPRHMRTPEGIDRLIRVTTACILANAELRKCTPASLVTGIVQAAQLGLEPTGQYGGAYLVPFFNKDKGAHEAVMIPDYRGIVDIVRRSGQLKTIGAEIICENDQFSYRAIVGMPDHRPAWNVDRGAIIGVWAAATLMNGGEQFVVMSKSEVDGIKALSRGAKSKMSPWNTEVGYPEMAKKTAIRRLCKLLPRSIELMDALEKIDTADPIDVTLQQSRAGLYSLAMINPPDEPDEESARRVELLEAIRAKWSEAGITAAAQVDAIRAAGGTPVAGADGSPDLTALSLPVLSKLLEA